MADPYNPDTTMTTLSGHVTGDNANNKWHMGFSANHYAWVYIVGALVLLWLMGGAFKSVLS
jgi:hypothetical protein